MKAQTVPLVAVVVHPSASDRASNPPSVQPRSPVLRMTGEVERGSRCSWAFPFPYQVEGILDRQEEEERRVQNREDLLGRVGILAVVGSLRYMPRGKP